MSDIDNFPPKTLSINHKTIILTDLRSGLTMKELTTKHRIPAGQILLIAAKEQVIWELFSSQYFNLAQGMPLKRGTYPRMENILYQYIIHHPGNYKNADFIEMARNIVSITEEKPSRGSRIFIGTISWANGFKKRYNITSDKPTKQSMINTANNSLAFSKILNERTGEMVIKTEKSSNEGNSLSDTTEGIFVSPSFLDVQINENSNQSNMIEASEAKEVSLLNTTPIELNVKKESVKALSQNQMQPAKRTTKRVNTMSPNWALQVFSQALKWTKENPTEEADIRVLRKLHKRCMISMNNVRKIKKEK